MHFRTFAVVSQVCYPPCTKCVRNNKAYASKCSLIECLTRTAYRRGKLSTVSDSPFFFVPSRQLPRDGIAHTKVDDWVRHITAVKQGKYSELRKSLERQVWYLALGRPRPGCVCS